MKTLNSNSYDELDDVVKASVGHHRSLLRLHAVLLVVVCVVRGHTTA